MKIFVFNNDGVRKLRRDVVMIVMEEDHTEANPLTTEGRTVPIPGY
jgi:hypothetical protein